MSSLKELEPYVDSAVGVLLEKLSGMLGHTVDMGNWVQLYAFGMYTMMILVCPRSRAENNTAL